MTGTLLNISGKVEAHILEVCHPIQACSNSLDLPYLIVGATARDLVMQRAFNAPIKRATTDIDFAVQVPSWHVFNLLAAGLVERGFTQQRQTHRLIAPNGFPVDIVPFGDLADRQSVIQWPPDNFQMTVLGFQEAYDTAYNVCLSDDPRLEVKVASPEGLVLLKLISWTDRAVDIRRKDAADIGYLLSQFEVVQSIEELMFTAELALMEKYAWDLKLACVHYLGKRVKAIASIASYELILTIFDQPHGVKSKEALLMELERNHRANNNGELLVAFENGLRST